MVLSVPSFHLCWRGRRKFCGGGPSVVAGLRAVEEKKAAFAAGVNWRDSGEKAVYGRARASAVTVLLVAIVWMWAWR